MGSDARWGRPGIPVSSCESGDRSNQLHPAKEEGANEASRDGRDVRWGCK